MSILGSLNQIEKEEFDLVLTNPPFVVTGTGKFKEFIKESGPLSSYYSVRGTGVESLFVEKIVRGLKKNGKALVIIPDGIANRGVDSKVRAFIRKECFVEAVVSLPPNAFYTTDKKTYVLVLTKKVADGPQTDPVFSYLVTQTGETLDANRFECPNDLPEMVRFFKYFKADKANFVSPSPKCKVWPIDAFAPEAYWSVDRWWTTEERQALGIIETKPVVTVKEFTAQLEDERKKIEDSKQRLLKLQKEMPKPEATVEIALGNTEFFELFIGERVKRKDYHGKPKGPIPVWSADMEVPFAWDTTSNIKDFESDFVLWGIDSDLFEFKVIRRKGKSPASRCAARSRATAESTGWPRCRTPGRRTGRRATPSAGPASRRPSGSRARSG